VKYNKKEALRSIIPQEEETSTLAVDSEEEEEEEVWVEVEDRSSVTTASFMLLNMLSKSRCPVTQGNNTATEKTQVFDAKKEKQVFEEARKEFGRDQGSSLKTRPELRE
jgi:hypothetical protein